MLNEVILMGRLTADPELKTVNENVSMAKFTLAVDRPVYGDKEKMTDFIPIVAWRHTAEFINRNFSKGMQVYVVGRLETRSWDDENGQKRYGYDVNVNEVGFAEPKKNSNRNGTPANGASQMQSGIPDGFDPFDNVNPDAPADDLPY